MTETTRHKAWIFLKHRAAAGLAKYLRVFRFGNYLKRQSPRLAGLVAARLAGMALNMTMPLFTRYLIDDVVSRRDWSGLRTTGSLFAGVLIASMTLIVLISLLSAKLDLSVIYDLRRCVQRKWEKAEIGYFNRWGIGEHLYRATTDVDNVRNVLLALPPRLLIMVLEFCIFFCVAAWLNLRLTMLFAAALPLLALVEVLYAKWIRPVQERLQDSTSVLNTFMGEYVEGIMTIKVFCRERILVRRALRQLSWIIRQSMSKWRIDTIAQVCRWSIPAVFGWFVFFLGIAMVMKGQFTLGSLIALRMYLSSLEKPINEAGELVQALAAGSVSADRLITTLTAPEEQSKSVAIMRPSHGAAAIQIKDLTFGYRDGIPILRGLSTTLPAGHMIGITGPSGGGKTTLVSLISRFYDPWHGSIHLDGADIREFSPREMRSAISIVLQDGHMFPGTIYENIACGNPRATFEEVTHAAQMADAHEFIMTQSAGYETVIGGSVSPLSQGQRQRVAIARALLKKSRLVVFDEAMSALDSNTRHRVVQSLRGLLGERTILVITHDPALLMQCDSVVLIMNGMAVKHASAALACGNSDFYDYLVLKSTYERHTGQPA